MSCAKIFRLNFCVVGKADKPRIKEILQVDFFFILQIFAYNRFHITELEMGELRLMD